MPTIRRKTIIRYVLDGRRVPRGTPRAKKVRERSAKWYGYGVPGHPPDKGFPLLGDRAASERMLRDLVTAAERGAAGLPDRAAAAAPLAAHLDRFAADLAAGLASRARKKRRPSPKQAALVAQRVRDAAAACGWAAVADLGPGAARQLSEHLAGRVGLPRATGGCSHQTAAFVLVACRRFAWWLSARARAAVRADLFDDVPGFEPGNNRVHARRECSPGELAHLLDRTRASPRAFRGLAGPDRYHLYLTAFATGYRAEELSHLTPAMFQLDADVPAAVLPGRLTKNGRPARQPLPPGVAGQLRPYLAAKPAGRPVWPGPWWSGGLAAKMLRRDLAAADIPYEAETPDGPAYLDFHALRHSFVSALAAAAVGPKELQVLARHSDPRLTLGVYAHARPEALGAAVGLLPVPGRPADPLAGLTRPQLEDLVRGLAGLVAVLVAGRMVDLGRSGETVYSQDAKPPAPAGRRKTP